MIIMGMFSFSIVFFFRLGAFTKCGFMVSTKMTLGGMK
jgi:hypothetical protein